MTDDELNVKDFPRRRYMFIGVFIFTLILVIVLFSDYGVVNRIKLNGEINSLNNDIRIEQNKTDSLKMEIKLLEKDNLTIEKVARQKYGMIKKNEEVIIIPDTVIQNAIGN